MTKYTLSKNVSTTVFVNLFLLIQYPSIYVHMHIYILYMHEKMHQEQKQNSNYFSSFLTLWQRCTIASETKRNIVIIKKLLLHLTLCTS